MKRVKRGIVISDPHCLSMVGLTPPHWQWSTVPEDVDNHNKIAGSQAHHWAWFDKSIKPLGRLDFAMWLGDMTEGASEKDSGTDTISTNMLKQVQCAVDVVKFVNAKKNIFVFGSNYNVKRVGVEFESLVAKEVSAKIGMHEFVEINGLVFNLKHHPAGNSKMPHTKGNALAKDKVFQDEWAGYHGFPQAGVIARGHTHRYYHVDDGRNHIFHCPAMKMLGDPFGSKYFHGIVNTGFLYFEIEDEFNWDYKLHQMSYEMSIPKIIKLY